MTHKTGPRPHMVDRLGKKIRYAIDSTRGCTMSEVWEAMHESQMVYLHDILAPWEDECPTCPKDKPKMK